MDLFNAWASFESILNDLMELQPVEEGGTLMMKPKFSSFPIVAQSRILFKVLQQSDKISKSTLQKFISLLQDSSSQNYWIQRGIFLIKSHIEKDVNSKVIVDGKRSESLPREYTFTKQSEDMKNTLISKLLHEIKPQIFDNNKPTEQETRVMRHDKDMSKKAIKDNAPSTCIVSSKDQRNFDVGQHKIIDVELDNKITNLRTKEFSLTNTKEEVETFIDSNCIVITSESEELEDDIDSDSKVLPHKRSHSDNIKMISTEMKQDDKLNIPENLGKKRRKNKSTFMATELLPNQIPDASQISEKNLKMKDELSEMQLSSVKERLLSDCKNDAFIQEFWGHLMNLNHDLLPLVCNFLELRSLPEDTLLILCDSLSSSCLSHQVESAFLNYTLSDKLSSLNHHASHTLLNVFYSVIQHKPKTAIELICTSLEQTKSGEPQCQLLSALCKNMFPVDHIPVFFQQLLSRKIEVNSHLVSALHILVNRIPTLETDSLKMFLTSLSRNSENLCSNISFGKLLLNILLKFKIKITAELKILMDGMVNEHRSSLKRTLLKKLEAVENQN